MDIVVPFVNIMRDQEKTDSVLVDIELSDFAGKSWFEHSISHLPKSENNHYTFLVPESAKKQLFLDLSIQQMMPDARIVSYQDETKGLACAVLFASEYIGNDELLIISGNQIVLSDYFQSLGNHNFEGYDSKVLTFQSTHPRWSYVRVDELGDVAEASQQGAISNNAIAGIYYFQKGSDFLQAAQQIIRKDNHSDGKFCLAPTLNELLLAGKRIGVSEIVRDDYLPLYTPADLESLKRYCNNKPPLSIFS